MTERPKILILGGTGDAVELAKALTTAYPHALIVTSLAGRTKTPAPIPGKLRIGGFGGATGLATYLHEGAFTAVIDATHPFASMISKNAFEAAQTLNCPLLRLERPAWQEVMADNWIKVPDTKAAAQALNKRALNKTAARVLLTTGYKDIADFAGLENLWFLVRLIDPPAVPLPLTHFELLCARGPFMQKEEIALMRDKGIDALVTKNSGGDATYGKISAARRLQIPVVMIERPKSLPSKTVSSGKQVIDWLRQENILGD